MKKAYIVMAGGRVFEGRRFGADADAVGEMVFTTGMGGYIETLTDPSYFGQIVVQTFPLAGNYGMIRGDWESRGAFLRGYVAREACDCPSNFRSEGTLDAQLKAWGVPGVCGVDTREITRAIREGGEISAMITSDPSAVDFERLRAYRVTDAIASVSRSEAITLPAEKPRFTVAVYDLGAKQSMIDELTLRGCTARVFGHAATAKEMLAAKPDGIFVTSGPGDPAENARVIQTVKELLGKAPMMGICLGHQVIALAAGASRVKMKFGHRGANQPVKRLSDGRVFITSQSHGYAIVADGLPDCAQISMVNANDGSCEGLYYPQYRAISTQFHPEARGGPRDTRFLFDEFISMMGGEPNAAQ